MIKAFLNPVAHASENQSTPEFAARLARHNNTLAGILQVCAEGCADTVISRAWSVKVPAIDNVTLTETVLQQKHKMLAGDVVYVTEVRRHVVTDDELNAAARVVIGGTQ